MATNVPIDLGGAGTTVATTGAYDRLRILTSSKTIAMVGLSSDLYRPSAFAAIYMLSYGYDIIPVNPRHAGGEILGQKVYASLADIPRPVDIVDVFRRAEEAPALAEEAVKIGAKVFWLQLGIENEDAGTYRPRRWSGIRQNRCVKIEHARFFGGLNLVGMNTGVITSRRTMG